MRTVQNENSEETGDSETFASPTVSLSQQSPHPEAPHQRSKWGMRLIHHRHTGRRLPHECTSYAAIFFILIFAAASLLFVYRTAQADSQQFNGSIDLTAKVPAPPPTTASQFTSPDEGTHVTGSIITVSGNCQKGLFVDIYRTKALAGSVTCDANGRFRATITLIPGANQLVLRTRDTLGQYAPDSAVRTVYYDRAVTGRNSAVGSPAQGGGTVSAVRPLLVYIPPVQNGVDAGSETLIKYQVNGGTPPYAISIKWGDNTDDSIYSYQDEGSFSAQHTYAVSGQHTITITATDIGQQKAVTQTTVIVNSAQAALGNIRDCDTYNINCVTGYRITHIIDLLWIPLIITSLMAFSFWAGERYMYMRDHRAA